MTTLRGPAGFATRRHEIPTHLDVEDRLLLGLPARRALALLCGLAFAYSLWHEWPALPEALRTALAGACVLVAVVGAFVRPGGRGLETWGLLWLRHAVRPRVSVWRPDVASPAEPAPPEGDAVASGWRELAPRLDWELAAGPDVHAIRAESAVREAQPWAS